MADCDGFFGSLPFEPAYQDEAVRMVRAADFHDVAYKKWLIICWFQTTYGTWTGSRFDAENARLKMAEYLLDSKYSTYEAMLDDPLEAQ